MAWALTCLETVQQRPCMTREIKTCLSDSRISNNSVVDHRSRRLVLSALRNCVDRDVTSDHIGHWGASHGCGCSKTSAYAGQFGWVSMIWSILSVATLWHRGGAALLSNTDYLRLDTSRHIMSEMTWLKWIIAFIIFTVRLVAYHNNSQFHWINSSQ